MMSGRDQEEDDPARRHHRPGHGQPARPRRAGLLGRACSPASSGIGRSRCSTPSAFKVHFGGEVKDFDPEAGIDAKAARRLDRFAQFALVAAAEAVEDSGIDFAKEDPFRCGVIVGSGIGGLNEFEEQHAVYLERRARRGSARSSSRR